MVIHSPEKYGNLQYFQPIQGVTMNDRLVLNRSSNRIAQVFALQRLNWNAIPERLTHSGFTAISHHPNQKGGKQKQDSGTVTGRRFEVAKCYHSRQI